MSFRRRDLLPLDCAAGSGVGALVVVASGWLAGLYEIPQSYVLFNGAVSLVYGAFGLSLLLRKRRPLSGVSALAVANMAWGVVCLVAAGTLDVGWLPRVHLIGEALFVGGLGALEWRWRRDLAD